MQRAKRLADRARIRLARALGAFDGQELRVREAQVLLGLDEVGGEKFLELAAQSRVRLSALRKECADLRR